MTRQEKTFSNGGPTPPTNIDPESQPKLNDLERDGKPAMPGRSSGISLHWWSLFGIPIPVGLSVGLKVGGSLPDPSPHAPKRIPKSQEKVWDSALGRFVTLPSSSKSKND